MDKDAQTRKLRYSKSLVERFSFEEICNDLYDIQEECENVKYMVEDEDVLVSALGDNDEEAYEFRMMFSELSAKCEQLYGALYDSDSYGEEPGEYFDEFFAGVADGSGMKYYAWDVEQEDYYNLTSWEGGLAAQEAQKKLKRMTKETLIACANRCFRIMTAYLDLKYKYDYLSATLQILNDEQKGVLDMVKELDAAYTEADKDNWYEYGDAMKRFDRILSSVPERMWIE